MATSAPRVNNSLPPDRAQALQEQKNREATRARQAVGTKASSGVNPWAATKAVGLGITQSLPWPFNLVSPIFKGGDQTPTKKPKAFINGNGTTGASSNILDNPALGKVVTPSRTGHDTTYVPSGTTDDPYGAWQGLSFGDAAAQMQDFLSSLGVGQSVSYDPLRNQARSQWQDADARTLAMYQQLQNSIGAQAGDINQVFDTGLANTNQATDFANKQELGSQQSLADMQTQQAQALGIGEAVANNINSGNYAAKDAAARAADTAARGQITSNLLNTNRTTALTGNANLAGAAGLTGAMERSKRQNELAKMLAGYDVQEQQANQDIQSNYVSQLNDGIWKLLGLNRDDFKQMSLNEYNSQTAENQDYYNQGRLAQGGTSASGGTALSLRDQAIQAAMDDYNLTGRDYISLTPGEQANVLKRSQIYMK